jgi:hypothetical protein
MNRKQLISAVFLVCAIAVGCSKEGGATTNTGPSQDPARAAMDTKLKEMTPEERAKYVQDHADEIRTAYSGVPAPRAGQ